MNKKRIRIIGFVGYLAGASSYLIGTVSLGGGATPQIVGCLLVLLGLFARMSTSDMIKKKSTVALLLIMAGLGYLLFSLGLLYFILAAGFATFEGINTNFIPFLIEILIGSTPFLIVAIPFLIFGILLLLEGARVLGMAKM